MKTSNVSYKWKKLFASKNYVHGMVNLDPFELQELINDIDKEFIELQEEIKQLKNKQDEDRKRSS